MMSRNRAWIEIDMKNLQHNVKFLSSILSPKTKLMPAVKANAYGHGAVEITKALENLGISDFCVASAAEGIELREAGISGQILVLGYTPVADIKDIVSYDLTQTVVDIAYAKELQKFGRQVNVHIGIDTGMHRLGIPYDQLEKITKLWDYTNLNITGVYSHLCVADSKDEKDRLFTRQQINRYNSLIKKLHQEGIRGFSTHLQSSYGILNYPKNQYDYARIGIALYGILSTQGDKTSIQADIKPVLSLKSRIISVRTLKKGEGAGYGLEYIAEKDSKIATVSIGYADGVPRALSGKGFVLCKGKRIPIVGRICMDQLLVDISDIPVDMNMEEVVLIGRSGQEEITVPEFASWADTISNEIVSRIGVRVENS